MRRLLALSYERTGSGTVLFGHVEESEATQFLSETISMMAECHPEVEEMWGLLTQPERELPEVASPSDSLDTGVNSENHDQGSQST